MMKDMPNNLEAEKGVIGSCLLEPNRVVPKVTQLLTENSFTDRKHQVLFSVLKEMNQSNQTIDSIVLLEELDKRKLLNMVGGKEYLLNLMDTFVISSHSEHYSNLVLESEKLRKEINILSNGLKTSYNGDSSTEEILSQLISLNIKEKKEQSLDELGEQFINNCIAGEVGKCPWWCDDWTNKLGKITTDLIILHAPRSTGKTALMLQWMLHLHNNKMRSPLASLEMLRAELMPRLIANYGVNTYFMRSRGFATDNEITNSRAANQKIKLLNLTIRDKAMDISEIKAWSISEKQKGADMLFIDNLLCIKEGNKHYDNKTTMYDNIIRELKQLRDDLEIPICLLAHPNAENKIAYSSSVENFADIIIFLMECPPEGVKISGKHILPNYDITGKHLLCKFQKNRNGISPTASIQFEGDYQRFKHLEWID